MNSHAVSIVDRGQGPQLSTSRVTVQDLVPFFQEGCSDQEIRRWIPSLTLQEISVAEAYYREHKMELDKESARIREQSAQNDNPAWVKKLLADASNERRAILERLHHGVNGEAE
jgi:uncharacterized protein (DUF433 family)